jgi:hypothetical protein
MECMSNSKAVHEVQQRAPIQRYCPVSHHKQQRLFKVCEISSSHGGEYDVQSCLLGCTAM